MAINSVATQPPASSRTSAGSNTTGNFTEAGKDIFLRLLVTQLEHQDPLSPMDNSQFTAQLAQFSTLEQMEAMNASLGALVTSQGATSGLQAAGLIGKEVTANGNLTAVHEGATSPLQFAIAKDSTKVAIAIYDQAGKLVRVLEKGRHAAGTHSVQWNGKDGQGNQLPDGSYRFNVTASNAAGNPVAADTFIQGPVERIEYVNHRPLLVVQGNQIELTSVTGITTP